MYKPRPCKILGFVCASYSTFSPSSMMDFQYSSPDNCKQTDYIYMYVVENFPLKNIPLQNFSGQFTTPYYCFQWKQIPTSRKGDGGAGLHT